MKQTILIGSTVIDVILMMSRLPQKGEDMNIKPPVHRLGGCAYNVFETLRFFNSPAILCSPVGTGFYGRMVQERMDERGIIPIVKLEEENGCCYCLIEEDGERSFLSCHGAEYLFFRTWLKGTDFSTVDSFYVSGIDLEVPTGEEIIRFIFEHPEQSVFFSPGPRIMHIEASRLQKMLRHRDRENRGPLLHLNERESMWLSGKDNIKKAAAALAGSTNNAVIITTGEKGCYYTDRNTGNAGVFVPGYPAKIVDTTCAGDVHLGALMACLKKGNSLGEACVTANRAGAAACGMHGAVLADLPDADKLRAELRLANHGV